MTKKLDGNIKENRLARMGVTKPYTVFVMIAVVILLGFFAFSTLKLELFPKMELPYVVIINSPDDTSIEKLPDGKTPKSLAWIGVGPYDVLEVAQKYSEDQETAILRGVEHIKNIQYPPICFANHNIWGTSD